MASVQGIEASYCSVSEAAQLLGVSRQTVWRLIERGVLKSYTSELDRRRRYVKRADLKRVQRMKEETMRAA